MFYRFRHTKFFVLFCCLFPTFALAGNSYFTATSSISNDLTAFRKWTGAVSRTGEQRGLPDDQCDKTQYYPCNGIALWKRMLDGVRDKPLRKQVEVVNRWANKHPYIVDRINWGMEDFWETPFEFISINGDCEDYAIAKYYSLRDLGIAEDRMRIIVLQDYNLGGVIHAVLGVYDDEDKLLILDNQTSQVIPALKIYHYRPIYALNQQHWWVYNHK